MITLFDVLEELSKKAIYLSDSSSSELKRSCWMLVHEYKHGVLPVEYDIREIDEGLYLDVLKYARTHLKQVN